MLDTSQMDLRALARSYYEGLLGFDQYRRARRELLDRMTGDATAIRQPPPTSTELSYKPVPVDKGVTKRRFHRPILFWSLFVVLLIMVAWVALV
ncbi:MAG: hypothetical protein P8166_13615 [Candidatus Thiodiazotropha sp.]|jgi:hypothetical protein